MDHLGNFLETLRANGYEPVTELRVNAAEWGRLKFDGESALKASGGYKLLQNPDGSYFANYGRLIAQYRNWANHKDHILEIMALMPPHLTNEILQLHT